MDLRAIWEEAVDEGVKVVRQEWYTKGNELRAVCMNSKNKSRNPPLCGGALGPKNKGIIYSLN